MSLRILGSNPWQTGSVTSATLYNIPLSGAVSAFTSSYDAAMPMYYSIPITSSISSSLQVIITSASLVPNPFSASVQDGMLTIFANNNFTIFPGFISIPLGADTGLRVQLTDITFDYSIISSSVNRRGIYGNASTGSPQLSLEAVSNSLDVTYPGDIWYITTQSYDGENGYRVADENKSDNSVFVAQPLFSRVGETSASVVTRYGTVDGPKNINLAASSLTLNDWFITTNSASISGRGWLNADWSGGIYMPDSNSVAIFGMKDFLVPSGNLIVSGTISASAYIGSIESSSYALTSSYALSSAGTITNAISASYAATASLLLGSVISSSYALTASYASNATLSVIHYIISASVPLLPSYQIVSSGSEHLATGIYAFSILANDSQHQNETYTGQLSWFAGNTNSTGSDEVIMHRMGQSPGSMSLYLRTRRQTGNQLGFLEVAGNLTDIQTGSYNFTFVKIL